MTQPRQVAIVGGNRTPFARSNIVYATASNQEMLTSALEGLVERYNLHSEHPGEVVADAVLKHLRDFNLIREHVLGPRLVSETPAYDIQQACDAGLEVAILVANKTALGRTDSDIAGGVDTTSDALIGVNGGLCKILLEVNRGKSNLDKLKNLLKTRPCHVVSAISRNGEPRTGLSMGESYELTVQTWQIPRDEQDRLAFESHHKLAAAYKEGWQNDLMTPFRGLIRDQDLRPDIDLEKISAPKPVFERGSHGALMATNSTPLTDGASVILLASEEWTKACGLSILAYFKDGEAVAVNFVDRQEGLLTAPVYAVPRLLARNGLGLQDFDYYEIYEAFAAQVFCIPKAWGGPEYRKTRLGFDQPLGSIDRSKLNVKGSPLAAGHSFAAMGGRIAVNLAKLFSVAEQERGLISICATGGQGATAIIER